ncbi:hypothetical protein PNA2_1949 [Pyrococcus sp. NA2]|uniref:ABC transporter permease n=1 Tax=Pyrococcus sp. (strain NA2) TaxID=342949 RepID=UPI000209AE23|nr:ABC transporter permease [Pyrococcus sp. NA2]AEC52863.1 hypothetical protein PNA2_1949 [Pyrococcus sp. NA2]
MGALNIAVKELETSIRTKRFYAVLMLFIVLALLFIKITASFAGMLSTMYVTPFQELFLSSLNSPLVYSITLISLLLGVTAINSEIEKGTIKILYSKPIYRDTIIFGKLLGGFLLLAMVLGIFYLIIVGISLVRGVPISSYDATRLLAIYPFSILYGLAMYSLGLFLSTLIRSQRNGIIAGVLVFLLIVIVIPMILAPLIAFVIVGPPTFETAISANNSSVTFSKETQEWTERYVSTLLKIYSLSPLYHYEQITAMIFGQKPTEEIIEQMPAITLGGMEFIVTEERPIIEGLKLCVNNIVAILVLLFVSLGLSYYKFLKMDLR